MFLVGLLVAGCGEDDSFRSGGSAAPPGGGGGTATQLTVSASAASMPSDGTSPVTITAFARDATNNLIAGVPITFTASSGGVSGIVSPTGTDGTATATLGTAGDSSVRTITVTATSGTLIATVPVQVTSGSGPPINVSMGSGTGANFQAGVLGVNSPALSSGGSTTLNAVLQQSDGTPYTQSTSITFNSPCAAQNLATITSPVVTTTGTATATYVATGCSGADVVTGSATIGASTVSATGTITVAPGVIGSIIFVSATPTNIALRGTGSTGHPETSTVIFRVLDQAGGPRVGQTVNFALNTTVGGIQVAPATAQSDAQGNVQTVVQGGTVATTVRVTATVQGVTPVLATQSSQLTITTGIPDQDSFSLAVQCPNVEAWSRDGEVVSVTARLSDRFNNPVPDGTAVTLQTEGGSIVSQCQTGGNIGTCSVNWTSSNPRPGIPPSGPNPRAGRSTVLATAIGEESFTDTNGNGSFDNGEAFADLAERFLDENENDVRDPTEPIYDFNNNATYDAPDTDFNGVLCLDTAGRCGVNTTTGISADNLIIMSGSSPTQVVPTNGTTLGALPAGGTSSYSFLFQDLNFNPMPAGTTIAGTVAGTGLTLGTPATFTVPCTTEPTSYPFTVSKAAMPGTGGTLTIRVTTPSGLESILVYGIP
jgi:hypothetical protein